MQPGAEASEGSHPADLCELLHKCMENIIRGHLFSFTELKLPLTVSLTQLAISCGIFNTLLQKLKILRQVKL